MPKFLIVVFCKFYGLVKEDFRAMCILTLCMSLNAFTLIGYYKTIVQRSSHIMLPTIYEIIIIGLIGAVNYTFFLKGKRYKTMCEEFKQDKSMSGGRGTRTTAIYIILTLAMLVSLIWLARMNIKN